MTISDVRTVTLPLGLGVMQSYLVGGRRIYEENGEEITRKRAENNIKLILLPLEVDAAMGVCSAAELQREAAKIRAFLDD